MERKELTDIILKSVSDANSMAADANAAYKPKTLNQKLISYMEQGGIRQAEKYLQSIGCYYQHLEKDNGFRCRQDLHGIKDYLVRTISSEADYGLQNSLGNLLKWIRPAYIIPALTIAAYFTPFRFGNTAELFAVGSLIPITGIEVANFRLNRLFRNAGSGIKQQDEERKRLLLVRKALKAVPVSEIGEVLQKNMQLIRPMILMV